MKRYLAALLVATALFGGAAEAADKTPIRFIMDWRFEGALSMWPAAAETGCFADNNLEVKIDPSAGSGDALSKVGSGTYDIGVADFSSLVGFEATHPEAKLITVFVVTESSAMSVVTLKKYGISRPQDLAGKRIADQEGESARVMFPAFAKANNIDPNSITWISVAPNLRQPMLVKGEADAAAGHLYTVTVGLHALGVHDDEIVSLPYVKWGVRAFGSSVVAKKAWASAHPDAMRAFLKCAAVGIKAAIANPKQAISWLKKYNSLVDEDHELEGLNFSNRTAIVTEESRKNGLSTFSGERLDQILTQVAGALNITKPAPDEIWTPQYLPPAAELKLP
jgi:NitT/TauT family transport system substrate-binding protein